MEKEKKLSYRKIDMEGFLKIHVFNQFKINVAYLYKIWTWQAYMEEFKKSTLIPSCKINYSGHFWYVSF